MKDPDERLGYCAPRRGWASRDSDERRGPRPPTNASTHACARAHTYAHAITQHPPNTPTGGRCLRARCGAYCSGGGDAACAAPSGPGVCVRARTHARTLARSLARTHSNIYRVYVRGDLSLFLLLVLASHPPSPCPSPSLPSLPFLSSPPPLSLSPSLRISFHR